MMKFLSLAQVILLLFFSSILMMQQPLKAAVNSSEICNKGTASLYFATVAENTKLFSSGGGMSQGFVKVAPNNCADIVPTGMNHVILTFFQKDSRGLLTNTTIVPRNANPSSADIKYVCINPKQPYRMFASKAEIFSKYVNSKCPAGFSPALPSWSHKPGGYHTYEISVHANTAAAAWRDMERNTYKEFPVLRQGSLQSDGKLVQINPYSEINRKQIKQLSDAWSNHVKKTNERAERQRARYWNRMQKKRAQHDARVKNAEQALTKPDASVCAPVMDKLRYKRGDKLTLSGVSLQMPAEEAHQALVCNGFSINPQLLARGGGIKKYWSTRREKVYQKTLENGRVVFTDVETLPRQTSTGSETVVMSVRIRYPYPQLLNKTDWEKVKVKFKKTYKIGKLRGENDLGIHRYFQYKGGRHILQLNAHPYRKNEIRSYSITML